MPDLSESCFVVVDVIHVENQKSDTCFIIVLALSHEIMDMKALWQLQNNLKKEDFSYPRFGNPFVFTPRHSEWLMCSKGYRGWASARGVSGLSLAKPEPSTTCHAASPHSWKMSRPTWTDPEKFPRWLRACAMVLLTWQHVRYNVSRNL